MFDRRLLKWEKSSPCRIWISLFMFNFLLLLSLMPLSVQAAYITDDFNITLRAEPARDAAIVRLLKNGTPIEVLEEREDWSRVKIEEGEEGWLLKRYVSEETPQKIQIEQLGKKLDESTIKLKVTSDKAASLEKENRTIKNEMTAGQERLEKVEATYKRLLADSGNVVEIKKNYEESTANLNRAMDKVNKLQAENNELRSTSELRWFLTGAGVVATAWIIGFIMGKLSRGKRHHSPFIS